MAPGWIVYSFKFKYIPHSYNKEKTLLTFFISNFFFHVSVGELRVWMKIIDEQSRLLAALGAGGGHTHCRPA